MSRRPDDLEIETTVSPDHVKAVMHVAGELDMTTAEQLTQEARRLMRIDGARKLQVDLSGVSFLDSSGIKALLLCRREYAERGGEFGVFGAQPLALKVLTVAGVASILGCDGEQGT
jgi:anti-sigma B factor antagonist